MHASRRIAATAARHLSRSSNACCRFARTEPLSFTSRRAPVHLRQPLAAFSTSRALRQGNEDIVGKLEQELSFEQDKLAQEESSSINEYLSSSPFQIEDVESSDHISLTRTYEDEQIKVTFSTSSLEAQPSDLDGADPALYDEEGGGTRVAPEDEGENDESRAGAAGGDGSVGGAAGSLAIPVTIQVSRGAGGAADKGAVVIAAYLDADARFVIEQIAWYPSAELAEGKTAEDELAKRKLYAGPPFDELDPDLQGMFEEYLEERGINTAMAAFIPEYIDRKETQEYVRWIQNVRDFLQ